MNNDRFSMIHNRMTIIEKLSILVEHKCEITANFGKNESLLTSIIEINIEDSRLILNCSGSSQLNTKMVSVSSVEFNAIFRNIHVAFTGLAIKKVNYKGHTVFLMYIPSSLYWCNRRRHSRMKIPVHDSIFCFCEIVLPMPQHDSALEYKQNYTAATDKIRQKLFDKSEKSRKFNAIASEILINLVQLELYDISQSGCSMLNCDEELSYFLTPHTTYEKCRIVTPNQDEINVSFKIMSKRTVRFHEITDGDDAFNELIGVEFLKIERQ